ncbi:ATP-binding protein [Alteromonas gilva]|uniref:histidine kinase n=1 Tax=Alteromonas gilva TaxID=2987522 RepID=A0ABT5L5E8_9ALTE|nr:ATP-binding protein [Alteromonas gilva]MDC8831591.1 ATP-binding protein [Alteromonas gilva]
MTRLFVSFYLFMAISLVLISSTLELVWPRAEPQEPAEVALAEAVLPLAATDISTLQAKLKRENIPYELSNMASTAWSAKERQAFSEGRSVTLYSDTARLIYAPLGNEELLVVTLPHSKLSTSYLLVYLSAFLLLLGVLLAVWLWPLWRDLSYLTRKVSHLGQEPENFSIALKKRSVMQPISNRLNMLSERVHNLLRDQRELTGAVAHEFRTPIARLKFALEMQPQPNSQAWKGIQADLDELEGLVQEMLEYTQYDAMTPELNIADIPARTLCENLIAKLAPTTTRLLSVSGEDLTLRGDGHFIERAVSNLLNNAIRHAKSTVNIHICGNDETITIAVHDDGAGIDPSLASRIFDPFYRPDNSRVRYTGGAGLGLAIVQRIQHWHNGTATVGESVLGGACFTLEYPLYTTD